MKMIYVGTLLTEPDRDWGWIRSFEALGYEVIPFSSLVDYPDAKFLARAIHKACNRLNIGPYNRKMERRLLKLISEEKPSWVHFRLPIGISSKLVKTIKSKKIVVTEYFNDDAFSKSQAFGHHWKFRRALPHYHAHFVWRERDVEIYKGVGGEYVEHSPPYYDPQKVYLANDSGSPRSFLADVAFIGHWENDWRVQCLNALKSHGFSVILGGGNMWDPVIKDLELGSLAPISEMYGDLYRKTYANVVAGLCFFSKINNDTWTRRALEIVAVGGVLVCERTEEAKKYFKDKEEAFFFSSIEELISIVELLKNDPELRENVRISGHRRLLKGQFTIADRAERIHKFAAFKLRAVYSS